MQQETFTYLETLYRFDPDPARGVRAEDHQRRVMALRSWMQKISGTEQLQKVLDELDTRLQSMSTGGVVPVLRASYDGVGVESFLQWVEEKFVTLPVVDAQELAVGLIASSLYEFAPYIQPVPISGNFTLRIERELASYAAWRNFLSFINQTNSRSGALYSEMEGKMRSIIEEAQGIITNGSAAALTASKALQDFNTQSAEKLHECEVTLFQTGQAREEFENAVAGLQTKVDGMEKLTADVQVRADNAIEEMLLDAQAKSGRTFWQQRAIASRKMFRNCGIGLLLGLTVIPAVGVVNIDALVTGIGHINKVLMEGLPADPTAAQLTLLALTRFLVLAAPLFVYVWLMRIVARLTMHSLSAAEDAEQRHTIIDTFAHLLGRGVAQPEDRSKMFDAIFRPQVSLTGDPTEPPTLLNTVIEKVVKPA